jgi:putative photosynthetic complex assembly protein 2
VLEIGLPILFAVVVWWFSTGAILYLDGLPRRTFVISLSVTGVAAVLALFVLWRDSASTDTVSTYVAFSAALVIWGWNEMAFLMGVVTGPRREPSNGRATGWQRFREASETVIYHEVAIALSALAIAVATWGAANMTGLWTFMVLWLMRLSTKINVFMGAPNITDEFLPPHLAYLSSYFRRRPMNGFFPLTVTVSTLVTAWLFQKVIVAPAGSYDAVSNTLIGGLMALAVLEHWLLFIPLPSSWLWSWSLRDRMPAQPVTVPATANVQELSNSSLQGRRS